jgi:hypothetical protein
MRGEGQGTCLPIPASTVLQLARCALGSSQVATPFVLCSDGVRRPCLAFICPLPF